MVENTAPKPSDWSLYLRLLSYVYAYWPYFLLSVVGFLIYSSAGVLMADLMQLVIDTAGGEEKVGVGMIARFLVWWQGGEQVFLQRARILIPLAMFAIVMLRGCGFLAGNYYINYVARFLVHKLRCEVFDHLLLLPSTYYDRNSSGHLLSRITFNVEQVTGAATNALKILIREGFTVIGLLAFLVYTNWKLSLVFIAVAPVIAMIVGSVGKLFRRYGKRIQTSVGDVTHVADEAINGYREVRMYGGNAYEQERFHAASEYNRMQSMKMALTNAASPPVIQLLVGLAMGVLVWLMLPPSSLGDLTSGQLVAFLTAAGMLAKPIRQLSEVLAIVQKGLAAAEDIFAYLDTEKERDLGDYHSASVYGKIEFRNVSFRYAEDKPLVLKDINFSVEPGQTVALVGASGGGKSTLVNLLTRFYNHTEGQILLDGVDVNNYSLPNLRSHCGFVSQNITLFNGTIYNNIAYGQLAGSSVQDVEEAAHAAHADVFIDKLPEKYQTTVGDNGVLLSGGQRQRIAIARALLKNSPLLILDEATSALDNESEQHIQTALETLLQGRTTFVIAHRLSTIEQADLILVMENGEVVEQGTHASLLADNKRYAHLYQRDFNS